MATMVLDDLKAAVTPQLAAYAAKMMGEPPANADRAIAITIPALLSGIAGATRMPSGLTSVTKLIGDPINDGSLLDQLPALYQGTMTAAPVYRLGSQVLHTSFGSKLAQVSQTIAMLADVKPAAAALLVATMAPHILAYLGQRQRDAGGLNSSAVATMFATQSASIHGALPAAFGHVFGAPSIAATAETRAGGGIAAVGSSAARGASARPTGAALWVIFPVGLALGTGLIGIGSLIADQLRRGDGPFIAAAVQTPPLVANTPVRPAEIKPAAEPRPAPAGPPPAAKVEPNAPAPPTAKLADAKPTVAAAPVPAQPTAPLPKGTTTYFGSTPSPAEQPARPNPDYRPAQVAVATNATAPPTLPPVPAPNASPAAAAPTPAVSTAVPVPTPGVTTYFGRGEAATAPSTAPATREACQTALTQALAADRILFETAKAELTSNSRQALARVATAFKSCRDARLKIEGHTDGNGAAAMNQALSEDRAQEVADYLIGAGIAKARMSAVGFGPTKPIAPNTSAGNRALNRRIDLVVD